MSRENMPSRLATNSSLFPSVMIENLEKTRTCSTTKQGPTQSKKGGNMRNRYNQATHLTHDTNGKVTTSQLDIANESQEVSPFPAEDHKATDRRS